MRRLLPVVAVVVGFVGLFAPVSALAQAAPSSADPNTAEWGALPGTKTLPAPTAPPPPPVDEPSGPAAPTSAESPPASGSGGAQQLGPAPASRLSEGSPQELPANARVPQVPPTPPPPSPSAAPPLPASAAGAPAEIVDSRNRTSIRAPVTLPLHRVGADLTVGYPLVSLRVGYGFLPSLDAGIGFDTLYGLLNEPRAWGRWMVAGGPTGASLALTAEAGAAFFSKDRALDFQGARFLTGRRNFNLVPGVRLGFAGESTRATRIYVSEEMLLALDTQTISTEPLGGLPPPVELVTSFLTRVGAEFPITSSTSFTLNLGFDIHNSPEDATFVPVASIGMVTSF